MYSSIALVALWGALAPHISGLSLDWQNDYRQARTVSARVQKPIAVFVGHGAGGWNQLVRDGGIDADIRKVLSDRYVLVYVNLDTTAGQKLADLFGLESKHGLIISDRSGGVMAFRHEGDLSPTEFAYYLNRYSDPNFVVSTTESNAPAYASAPTYSAPVIPASYPAYQNPFQCRT